MNIPVSSPAMTLLGSSHSSSLAFAQENIYLVSGRAGIRGSRAVWHHSPLSLSPQRSLTGQPSWQQGSLVHALGIYHRKQQQDSEAAWQLKPEERNRSEVITKLQDRSRILHLKRPACFPLNKTCFLPIYTFIVCWKGSKEIRVCLD